MRTGGLTNPAPPGGFGFPPSPQVPAAAATAAPKAASVRASLHQIFEWGRADITNAATSYADPSMPMNPGVAGTDQYYTRVMPRDGEIVTLDLYLEGDVGGSGKAYAVQVWLNPSDGAGAFTGWAATDIEATVTGAAGTEQVALNHSGGVSFNAGDLMRVYDKRTSTPSAVAALASVGVQWTEES